jgi:transcriptional regulator with XRE-family HTH domain
MRELRQGAGVPITALAEASGWAKSTLSRVEIGKDAPGLELVEYYDRRFGGDGLLLSLYAELLFERREIQHRRRASRRPLAGSARDPAADEGEAHLVGDGRDRSEFVADVTIPDGTVLKPGAEFVKVWEIRNVGEVAWRGRSLTRLGAIVGAALPYSPPRVPIPDTEPGQSVRIAVPMRSQRAEGTAEIHWKMTDECGRLCFPDRYPDGLVVTIVVRD